MHKLTSTDVEQINVETLVAEVVRIYCHVALTESWHWSITRHEVVEEITREVLERVCGFGTYRLVPSVSVPSADELTQLGLNAAMDSPAAAVDAIVGAITYSDTVGQVVRTDMNGRDVVVGGGHGLNSYTLTMDQLPDIALLFAQVVRDHYENRGEHDMSQVGRIESAGLIGERGQRGFISIGLPSVVVDPGGIGLALKNYATATDTADRSGLLDVIVSAIMAVCDNTVRAALAARDASLSLSLRHTSGMAAKMAAGFVEIAESSVAQAAAYAVQCEKLLSAPVTDDLWNVAMSQLSKAYDLNGLKSTATKQQQQSANGLAMELRQLAEEDPTNFGATGANALGVVQTLTGYVRNHREPNTRAVADAKDESGNLTADSVAAWRSSQADLFRTTGEADAETNRYLAAASAVTDAVLAGV